MVINGFSSYFELLASLCIAYVGFDYFRNEVKKIVFRMSKEENKLTLFLKSIEVEYVEKNDKELKEGLAELSKKIEFDIKKILFRENAQRSFIDIFKHISLISFFYCLTAIILGGFQSNSDIQNDSFYFYTLGVFGTFCLMHCLYVFILSYALLRLRLVIFNLWAKCVGYLFLSLVIVCFRKELYALQPFFVKSFFEGSFNAIILITPISLFLFLFVRVTNHISYYEKQIITTRDGYQQTLKSLKEGYIARNKIINK